MAFRDRFFTPRVARAIASPSGIVLAGAAASVGILAGLPIVGWIGLGILGWVSRVAASIPRADKALSGIDPLALGEPWRRFVGSAVAAKYRYDEGVRRSKAGPLRVQLEAIGSRIEDAVKECWRIASQGQALSDARSQLDVREASHELAELEASLGGRTPDPASAIAGTLVSLRAQLASADRLDRTIVDARDRLRLLDARLDEAVARVYELSARATSIDDLGGLGADVEGLVSEMEALRQGLEEVDGALPTAAVTEYSPNQGTPGTATG